MSNIVYIAVSLDGFIADKNDGLEWLESVPNPEGLDLGYNAFIESIDALVMGRNTFEKVISFDCEWPYSKPVMVLSNSLKQLPEGFTGDARLINGELTSLVNQLNQQGFNNLYIDGGLTIQQFLAQDLIDELILTRFPILLGGGAPLFGDLPNIKRFKHHKTTVLLDQLVQSHYVREP
ncbi:dihydrofolate reductase family protein [Agarivorans sp. 1_MG-2023]|uniref:dihydrofolate reductase family protein n=1 Tax=Agarivorans sp. 1_MG-2023 TaxID=3062634 RepID=UPI0026E3FF43|nr:dihydrofolate reductase family protein [Agarivorans sp. 1_MG-2023]MDO6763103.1 dihydrofolate reductase family protein [Agarivorans sp. 1_MG-2023]